MKTKLLAQFLQGIEQQLPEDAAQKLLEGPLRVKFGIDPSSPDIHLGHVVVLKKLRLLQQMGHQIVFLIGNFTAMIGDPTGKSETRKPLSPEQIAHNVQTYQDQVFRILDRSQTQVVYNQDWLGQLSAHQMIELMASSTVARMIERDDFSKRFKAGQAIALHEFLYPLLQGYDSVVLKSDVEMGGTDQTFNLLMGRHLQKERGQKPQLVFTTPILEGLDGVQKMSKSLGNHIPLLALPEDMFGKLMSIPDTLIVRYLTLVTGSTPDEIAAYQAQLNAGTNPKVIKEVLAKKVVTELHSEAAAESAALHFQRIFSEHLVPEELENLSVPEGLVRLDGLLVEKGIVPSKKEVQRLAAQGAISVDGNVVQDVLAPQAWKDGGVLKIGKRKFFRIQVIG